jgi:hypothetical protein
LIINRQRPHRAAVAARSLFNGQRTAPFPNEARTACLTIRQRIPLVDRSEAWVRTSAGTRLRCFCLSASLSRLRDWSDAAGRVLLAANCCRLHRSQLRCRRRWQ